MLSLCLDLPTYLKTTLRLNNKFVTAFYTVSYQKTLCLRERHGLAVPAVAARRRDISHRRGCRAETYKGSNFLTVDQIAKNVVPRMETIVHTVLIVSSRTCFFPRRRSGCKFRRENGIGRRKEIRNRASAVTLGCLRLQFSSVQ